MAPEAADRQIAGQSKTRTVMVVGATGTGKTRLARHLVERLAGEGRTVGFVTADMGQPSVGVPTCLALSMPGLRDQPSASWFVGDVTPQGNLLPTVVGTARLAEHARKEGADTVVVDTTGLVEGPVGRALKYHKALAAGADCILAVERHCELDQMLTLLRGVCPKIDRVRPVPEAKDRDRLERRAYREDRYRAHFRGGGVRSFDAACLIGSDWAPPPVPNGAEPLVGTVVGLLDRKGFCLGLGLIEEFQPDQLSVYTACSTPEAVVRVQAGRVRLDRHADFSEVR